MSKTLKVQVLITARALIEDEKHWVQNEYAVDDQDNSVDPTHDKAVRFFAVGAIVRAFDLGTGEYNWYPRCIPPKAMARLQDISQEQGHSAGSESLRQAHPGVSTMLYNPKWKKKDLH